MLIAMQCILCRFLFFCSCCLQSLGIFDVLIAFLLTMSFVFSIFFLLLPLKENEAVVTAVNIQLWVQLFHY
ncbi:MAG: hypothetical protein RIR11_742 [Bacteroidota bacterium]